MPLLLRATPRPPEDTPDCLAQGGSVQDCGPDFRVFADEDPLEPHAAHDSVYSIDMTGYICPGQECPAVIGNVAVYRDNSHLTSSYVETLAPMLDEKLREEIPGLY